MAAVHGRKAAVYFQGADLSVLLKEAEMSIDADVADVTTFADVTWRKKIAGLLGGEFTASGFYDPTTVTMANSIVLPDTGITTLTYCPGDSSAVGDLARLCKVLGTSYAETSSTNDAVAAAWSAQITGAVAFGYLLHPLAEDTNTTTGASKDDGAATATGWTAHLHVTAIDAGSWVVKLQDSADNSAWADVTGGAFTAVTVVSGERIVSATSTTTLRRYVRYVATRTGGTAGDGITFALAIARSNVT